MKKIQILACFIAIFALSSCDDFLSEVPDDRTQLDSKEKIGELLVFAYPSLLSNTFVEAMSDNVTDNGVVTMNVRENVNYYNWEDSDETSRDSPSGYWDACYGAIAQANQALDAIDKLGNTADLKAVRSEALLARAYAHFMLVSIWGKAYNPATASTDLGVPYVLEPELQLIKVYKRNTVQEVYDFIEADLIEAMQGVNEIVYSDIVKKFHFGPESARAFATRFYLNKGDWEKVLDYSSSLGSKPDAQLRNYVAWQLLPADPRSLNYASSEPVTNLLINTAASVYRRTFANNRFSTAKLWMDDIYSAKMNPFNKRSILTRLQFGSGDNNFLPKQHEYFKITNPTAQTGLPYMQAVLLSNEEMYYARIEALVMLNRTDEALSELSFAVGRTTAGYNPSVDILTVAKLKAFYPDASKLYTPFYTLTSDQAAIIQCLAESKRRELMHESNRWFDIKRYNLEVNHQIGREVITLTKDDLRKQFQIPQHVIASGVVANPR